jgi:YidC/Oxa1 family membrane protein insertase
MWDTLIINPMVNTLLGIYAVLAGVFGPAHMFGLAIIFFTALIRLITYPLTASQMKSTAAMQEFQNSKKWKEIQKKHKDDREKLAQEQMKLYQEMGINPFSSCLPLIIQLPIIFGLYQAISRALASAPVQLIDFSTHIYPFINAANLIPLNNRFLWMDLNEPERLVVFGLGIPVLTILVVITTYMQQKVMTPPPAPSADGQGAQMAQMSQTMNIYMPLFMGFIAYSLNAGVALYFVASNLLSILQYALMGKVNWRNLLPGRAAKA